VFSNASDGVCLNWCNQNPVGRFVGVEVQQKTSTEKRCYCLFSGGIPKSIKTNANAYKPAWDLAETQSGIGEVQTTTNRDGDIHADSALYWGETQIGTRSYLAFEFLNFLNYLLSLVK
jgi:hypothetical protein